jgi:Fe2+ or Zn2+ uptake regulation protein
MDKADVAQLKLRAHGIQPSAQRLAVAQVILFTDTHPSADRIWALAQKKLPSISRATVYNTLHLFVKKGIVRELVLAENKIVYDPKLDRHHHVIDERTGAIHDLEWNALRVEDVGSLYGWDVSEYSVVLRGKPRFKKRK